jgi:hypothetical protein
MASRASTQVRNSTQWWLTSKRGHPRTERTLLFILNQAVRTKSASYHYGQRYVSVRVQLKIPLLDFASNCVQNRWFHRSVLRVEASKANCINSERAMGIEPTSEGWETCAPNCVQNVTKKLPKLTELTPLTCEGN